jgi:hypothetical protein
MVIDPNMTDPGTWSPRLREVESRLRSHEDVCTERYERLRDDHKGLRNSIAQYRDDLNKRVDAIQHLLVKVALMLLGGMATILAAIVWLR